MAKQKHFFSLILLPNIKLPRKKKHSYLNVKNYEKLLFDLIYAYFDFFLEKNLFGFYKGSITKVFATLPT